MEEALNNAHSFSEIEMQLSTKDSFWILEDPSRWEIMPLCYDSEKDQVFVALTDGVAQFRDDMNAMFE